MYDRKGTHRSLAKLPRGVVVLAGVATALIVGVILYRIPAINHRLSWRVDVAMTTLRTILHPIGTMPTPVLAAPHVEIVTRAPTPAEQPGSQVQAASPPATPQFVDMPSPTPTDTPLPDKAKLPAPAYERQDWNSCGPAALAMMLHFYGWNGTQEDINVQIKPLRADRNVNIDELVSFVRDQTPGLRAEFRVGGSIIQIRGLLAAGFPVIIEETFYLPEEYWFDDDRWSGHYQLVTGYDDASKTFITQDSFVGPNRIMTYAELDENWQAFNRAYLIVYPVEKEEEIKTLLKGDWNVEINRQNALETARQETKLDPANPFAWFNLGSNLVYFERYAQAASAYDTARTLNLPQRMMRYQFGPFLAYFHSSRTEDLLGLADYALKVTPNSEEALLWKGWGLFRQGETNEAFALFQKALEAHPGYSDALYALNYLQGGGK
ncbi:MAG: C39 family peptidase [Anaerolineaceae bacterium]|nr:C39 family peptidase [Anaerolineaceae bacterium]